MSSNPWTDFQQEHAGEGLSPGEMSEMYHAEQDAGGSGMESPSTNDATDTVESVTDNLGRLTVEANSDVDTESSGIKNQEDAEKESSEVVTQNDDGESSSSSSTPENTESDSSTNENLNNDVQEAAKKESSNKKKGVSTKATEWCQFEHDSKGPGMTSTELSKLYRRKEKEQSQEEQPQQQ